MPIPNKKIATGSLEEMEFPPLEDHHAVVDDLGFASLDVATLTSLLEERFGVKAPNISAWRRHTAGDLTSTLHPKRSDPSVPKLPSTSKDQMADVLAEDEWILHAADQDLPCLAELGMQVD